MTRHEELKKEAVAFSQRFPKVGRLFEKFALEKIAAGYENYSADAVMHRVRWETDAGNQGAGYKINNNYVAFYARAFNKKHGREFFRTRRQRT